MARKLVVRVDSQFAHEGGAVQAGAGGGGPEGAPTRWNLPSMWAS